VPASKLVAPGKTSSGQSKAATRDEPTLETIGPYGAAMPRNMAHFTIDGQAGRHAFNLRYSRVDH